MKAYIKYISKLLCIGTIAMFTACKEHQEQKTMTTQIENPIFPKGEKLENGYFTGDAFLEPLLAKDKNNEFAMGSVTFEQGARTNWHIHPKGQILIVTEGEGLYQEKGKPAQIIKKGDVVNIPENVEHWHGASENTKMVHIAITNYKGEENVTWLKPVTDEEFTSANKR
jgi:quercetin dioxygenase-like cupin family protein